LEPPSRFTPHASLPHTASGEPATSRHRPHLRHWAQAPRTSHVPSLV
jgi:hypothetical protein